ncbi:HAD family hydrolase [Halalkalibacter urbisdiaboli]|uniref:HAD family hydrolase n=1 Tax=Halalkalibacter urbisdiaboli TaxID=1960589 RepID=UPI000B42D203|nr:HAD family hydrolase [Halalkalibacter urbisdiaboli]
MDSIIFDLDGTLWDSLDTVVDVWNDVLGKYQAGTIKKSELQALTGLPFQKIAEKLLPHLNKEQINQILDECNQSECEALKMRGGVLYPKVEETLQRLSHYRLFIVSNCQDGYIEAFYDYHKLKMYFEDYENPGRTGLSKGENIKLVIERNGLTSPVYVGDTEGDLAGAKHAGIPFVYASYGFGDVQHYDYNIKSFEELLSLF